jgi:hypothetical protein
MKRRFKSLKWLLMVVVVAVALVVVGVVLAVAVTIDTFDSGPEIMLLDGGAGVGVSDYANDPSILGGQREVYLYLIEDPQSAGADIRINRSNSHVATFNQGSGSHAWGRIVWDGQDNDGDVINKTGLSDVDLTDGDLNDAFHILVYSFDAAYDGDFRLGIWVYTDTIYTAYYTITLDAAISSPGETFYVQFSDFTGDQEVFEHAGAVELRLDPDADVDLTLDLFEINENPTAVTLASFDVTPQDNAILVTWETASELDNVGFNLYRSETEEGPYVQLNETLIPPQFPGEVMGGYYEWPDTDVQPGVTYFYKLEDIDVKGVSTLHGPVSTMVISAPAAVGLRSVSARGVATALALGLTMVLGLVVVYRRRRLKST